MTGKPCLIFMFPYIHNSIRGNSWWLKLKTFDVVGKKILLLSDILCPESGSFPKQLSTLEKLFNFSELQFVCIMGIIIPPPANFLWGLNVKIHFKHLVLCLPHSRWSIFVSLLVILYPKDRENRVFQTEKYWGQFREMRERWFCISERLVNYWVHE